ncbi:MAG: multiheme c-type cytochrome [Elusimicrobia bacterium]|nr:multiheme c-type cytochrome [Elusimicrobiota bacterium]
MNRKILLIPAALLFCLPAAAGTPEDEACLGCHADRASGAPQMPVAKLQASVHKDLGCTVCHAGKDGYPHEPKTPPVACGSCHAEPQKLFDDSLHGKALAKGDSLAPRCQNCHGSHDIVPVRSPASAVSPVRIPFVCGSCHREGSPVQKQRHIHQQNILENYSESIHAEGLLKKGLSVAATCASCHGSHHILPHTDPRSSIARGNITQTCERCHALIEEQHRKIINGQLWEKSPNKVPVCVDCHQPHKARKVFYDQGMADRDCQRCHSQPGLKSRDGRPMTVDAAQAKGSVHAKIACAQCHASVTPSHNRPCDTARPVDCSVCHNDQVAQYRGSVHGTLLAKGDRNAPACVECHGKHGILSRKDSRSATYPTKVPDLCARCHREGEKAAVRYQGTQHQITRSYIESVHGKGLLKSGLTVTATCTSCHTAHGELPASDSRSTVNKDNVAKTCSQCHFGVYDQYIQSAHSPAVAGPGKKVPGCNDCHTAHTIRRTDQEGFRLDVMSRCGGCHAGVAKSYFETYHGKVSQLGYAKTAKCHDCHGAHDIFNINDPRSHLSRRNIVETCQKCHPGATRRFAGYLTHATHHDPYKYPLIFGTFWAMTALLVGTFGFFWLHTLLWLPRALQLRREHPPKPYDPARPQFVRFPLMYRWLHGLLITSFLCLAATGMTLKFSYTPWAQALSRLLGGFESAGFIHRAAALLMFGLFSTHVWDLLTRKLQSAGSWKALLLGPDTMLPTLRDAAEFRDTLKWYLGRGPHPRYGRWTYWEKFDYFAVFWGVTIIGCSGLMLWMPETFTRVLPGWLINVATIIHSDEALLATGFIFTVHFFNTHLRPDKFPMDLVVFTGQMPLEDMSRERPQEYEAVQAAGKLSERTSAPLPLYLVKTLRVFAWGALGAGFCIIIGIIYAMLFAYR